jgi:hypothetical protein
MVRSAEAAARETKLAELKRLITTCHYESLEKLEDAVDALLWGDSEAAHREAAHREAAHREAAHREAAQLEVAQLADRPDENPRTIPGIAPNRPR